MWRYINALILILLFASPAVADRPFGDSTTIPGIWYVSRDRGMNTTATDTPWGWSSSYPFATIGQAYTNAATGETIVCFSGDTKYNEVVSISGKSDHYLGVTDDGRTDSATMIRTGRFAAASATNGVIIDGFRFEWCSFSYCVNPYGNGKPNWELRNDVFDSFSGNNYYSGAIRNEGTGITLVANCSFNNFQIQNYPSGDSPTLTCPMILYGGAPPNTSGYGYEVVNTTIRNSLYAFGFFRTNRNDSYVARDCIIASDTLMHLAGDFTQVASPAASVNLFYCDTYASNGFIQQTFDSYISIGEPPGVVLDYIPAVNATNCINTDPLFVVADDPMDTTAVWKAFYTSSVVGIASSTGGPLGVSWGYSPVAPPAVAEPPRSLGMDLVNWLKIIGVGF